MITTPNHCETCRHHYRYEVPPRGECRQGPPSPVWINGRHVGVWPQTLLTDGCHAHEPKPIDRDEFTVPA